ncbi:hypothetical protein N5T67_03755 [Aliarcobacter butzleri]|uniref:hypothetical protein n=1 Tax=Aliarcobacter butzleri TaxID=28197 RepID=UPI0021B1A298|nr:hypothetical protein [Aliarcobacter butzleri]MCT7551948.1 hypothetical protein [Aliarcobacter butzleri]
MSNIPIFRAKKIDSDEYVEGYLDIQKSWKTRCLSCGSLDTECYNNYYLEECKCNNCGKDLGFHNDNWEHGYIGEIKYLIRNNGEYTEIDPTTLSIHFPNMLDSQGSKIFASLQENGKGGDRILEESRLMCHLKIDESSFREFTAIHTINGNRFVNEKILSDIGPYRDNHFKGYDVMIYDFFMMKKRNIKIIGIQE